MKGDFIWVPKHFLKTEAELRDKLKSLALLVGISILIGIILSSLVWYILFKTGVFDQAFATRALPTVSVPCPTEAVLSPVCPTCAPMDTPEAKIISTSTATFTATPDFAATATAACGSHISRFPGTPCPPFATATPKKLSMPDISE